MTDRLVILSPPRTLADEGSRFFRFLRNLQNDKVGAVILSLFQGLAVNSLNYINYINKINSLNHINQINSLNHLNQSRMTKRGTVIILNKIKGLR
jgi:hypothetical protein